MRRGKMNSKSNISRPTHTQHTIKQANQHASLNARALFFFLLFLFQNFLFFSFLSTTLTHFSARVSFNTSYFAR
jgi:hypothetical protein